MSRKIIKYFTESVQENPINSTHPFKSLISALSAYYSVDYIECSTVKVFNKIGFQIGSLLINTHSYSENDVETGYENHLTFWTDRFSLYQNNETLISGSFGEESLFYKAIKLFFTYESERLKKVKEHKELISQKLELNKQEFHKAIENNLLTEREFRNKRNELVNKLRKLFHPKIDPLFVHELLIQFSIFHKFLSFLDYPKKSLEKDSIYRDFQDLSEKIKPEDSQNLLFREYWQIYFNEVAQTINAIQNDALRTKYLMNFADEFYGIFYQEKVQKRLGDIPEGLLVFCKNTLGKINSSDKNAQLLNLSPKQINSSQLFDKENKVIQSENRLLPYFIHLLSEKGEKTNLINPLAVLNVATKSLQTNLFEGNKTTSGSAQLGIQKAGIITFSAISFSSPENNFLNFEYFQKDKKGVDDKIKETYFANSLQPANAYFEPGLKYLRWSSDQLTEDGILMAILPSRYFHDQKFDGLRISLEREFSTIHLIDLGKISFQENLNPDEIWKNSTICFFQKNNNDENKAAIKFYQLPECQSTYEKSQLLNSLNFENIDFKVIKPENGNWFSQDYFLLTPLVEDATTEGKSIFKTFSKGIFPQDSQYLVRFHQENLKEKYDLLKPNTGKENEQFATRTGYYKPFVKKEMVYSKNLEKELQQFPEFFPFQKDFPNQLICTSGPGSQKPFQVLISDAITTYDFLERTVCFPRFFVNKDGNKEDNITDWSLKNFKDFYIPIIKQQIKEAKNKSDFLREKLDRISSFSKNLPVLHKFTLKIASIVQSKGQKQIEPNLAAEIIEIILDFEKKLLILGKDAKERKKMIATLKGLLSETKTELEKIGKSVETLERKQSLLTKENIFYYTYAILFDPDFQNEFQENLKSNFPRIPLKPDFWKYAENGKLLVELHLGLTEIPGYPISKNEQTPDNGTLVKPELKVNKSLGSISVDNHLELGNIPPKAWDFKMGNYSVLEILVKNYKKKGVRKNTDWKPFYRYDFMSLKEDFINDVSRLSALSIETQKILKNLELS